MMIFIAIVHDTSRKLFTTPYIAIDGLLWKSPSINLDMYMLRINVNTATNTYIPKVETVPYGCKLTSYINWPSIISCPLLT